MKKRIQKKNNLQKKAKQMKLWPKSRLKLNQMKVFPVTDLAHRERKEINQPNLIETADNIHKSHVHEKEKYQQTWHNSIHLLTLRNLILKTLMMAFNFFNNL